MPEGPPPSIACFATQGPGSNDEERIGALLVDLHPTVVGMRRRPRLGGALELWRRLSALDPDLVVMEGTGIAGGAVLLLGRRLRGRPYVVSSGDAVAPFVAAVSRPAGLVAGLYERLLCRWSAGFIGWSPYLAGRALTFGAPRAMTAANWASVAPSPDGRIRVRERLGLGPDDIVFGIVGSLNWSARYGYCYGLELVRAASGLDRDDIKVLVVGDGDGRPRLEEMAGDRLGSSILLPGAVPRAEVADHLAALDVASLPQSVDGVGAFRYTTKISEYLAARVPVVTGQIPLAYDLDDGWLWRLPGDAPWDERYVGALRELMGTVTATEIRDRRPPAETPPVFSLERQRRQAAAFVADAVERERARSR